MYRMANNSLIKDNYKTGRVGDFLVENIKESPKLSIVTAYFTIYAYQALKEQLDNIEHLRLLYGEPSFIKELDPNKKEAKVFGIEESKIGLSNRLSQKALARQCSDWIREKVDIKSFRESNLLHGKMYHIQKGQVEDALIGSSNFTQNGLEFI